MKRASFSLIAVGAIALAAAAGLRGQLAIAVPYAALAVFVIGLSYRVVRWSLSPVPFRIPTVCGQQKSLAWIKSSWIESPHTTPGVVTRMLLEVLLFRSLFRNTGARLDGRQRIIYGEDKFLWLGAMAFHWSLLFILIRHLRLFVEPAPRLAILVERIDGFFQIGAPVLYVTDIAFLAALLYLLLRRFRNAQVRYVSLFSDYFALFLLLGIGLSGVWMRHFARTDVVAVKQFAIGLATFSPIVPAGVGAWFFVHLGLISALAVYFPFSKLVHMGGVLLSPTRNLANNNRMKRHVNPWNYPVKVHTYEEWEQEFHDKIAAAGLPLEKP